jgi:hypothetical protein
MVAALAKVASSERRGDKWPADDDVHASEVIFSLDHRLHVGK